MMGFGFVVARFGLFLREIAEVQHSSAVRTPGLSLWIGTGLVVLGVIVTAMAALRHAGFVKRLDRGDTGVRFSASFGTIVSLALAAIGLTMAVYLISIGR